MPKTWPADVRLRAVALAEATDVPTAAKHFGITERTIREWIGEAPDRTELERAAELALSEVTVRLAKGESTVGVKHLTTVAAILQDKLHRYGRAQAEPPPDTGKAIEEWIDATFQGAERDLVNKVYDHWLDDQIHRLEAAIVRDLGRDALEPAATTRPEDT